VNRKRERQRVDSMIGATNVEIIDVEKEVKNCSTNSKETDTTTKSVKSLCECWK